MKNRLEVSLSKGEQELNNMLRFVKKNYKILAILLLGIFLRSYKFKELFLYSHDQDLAGWIIRDILSGHLRLIGQETSQLGVFIGPLYYYLLIPFYLLFGMDPLGGVFFSIILGAISISSIYFVTKRIFDKGTALFASLIYATSFLIVFTEREVVPTTPVMLWSVWYLYCLHLFLKKDQKIAFPLLGILAGLVWHLNLGLVLLLPLAPLALLFSKPKKFDLNAIKIALVFLFVFSIPLLAFEARHDFIQVKAITSSLGSESSTPINEKLDRVFQLVNTNTRRLFIGPYLNIPDKYHTGILLLMLAVVVLKKKIAKKLSILLLLWLAMFVAFFSINSIIVSEYYLNAMNLIWLIILSSFFSNILFEKWKFISLIVFSGLIILNIYRILIVPVNASGYIQRKAVVAYIKEDAKLHNYPCVSVSYITEPGYNLGYRYLFFLENLHVNRPDSLAPVYTIVFPHSMVDRLDKTFGALGLILPDYERYTSEGIAKSCSGENSNLTDPLFGYTD